MNKTIIALVLGGYAAVASAGFVNEATNSIQNPFAETNQVRLFGSQRPYEQVLGMGRDVTLSEAISQILPRNFTARFLGVERQQNAKVNWQGGKAWPDVLRDVLSKVPGVTADIDGDLRVATFRPSTEVVTGVNESAQQATATEWQLRADDKSLKGAVTRWAKVANWQLSWEMDVDYPISATATLTGTFESALETVVKSMQGAEVPPKVLFYTGNRVVRIVSKGSE